MSAIVVSGRLGILFDRVPLRVNDDGDEVDGWRCRWCGWVYAVDDKKLIPDHECTGPVHGTGTRPA